MRRFLTKLYIYWCYKTLYLCLFITLPALFPYVWGAIFLLNLLCIFMCNYIYIYTKNMDFTQIGYNFLVEQKLHIENSLNNKTSNELLDKTILLITDPEEKIIVEISKLQKLLSYLKQLMFFIEKVVFSNQGIQHEVAEDIYEPDNTRIVAHPFWFEQISDFVQNIFSNNLQQVFEYEENSKYPESFDWTHIFNIPKDLIPEDVHDLFERELDDFMLLHGDDEDAEDSSSYIINLKTSRVYLADDWADYIINNHAPGLDDIMLDIDPDQVNLFKFIIKLREEYFKNVQQLIKVFLKHANLEVLTLKKDQIRWFSMLKKYCFPIYPKHNHPHVGLQLIAHNEIRIKDLLNLCETRDNYDYEDLRKALAIEHHKKTPVFYAFQRPGCVYNILSRSDLDTDIRIADPYNHTNIPDKIKQPEAYAARIKSRVNIAPYYSITMSNITPATKNLVQNITQLLIVQENISNLGELFTEKLHPEIIKWYGRTLNDSVGLSGLREWIRSFQRPLIVQHIIFNDFTTQLTKCNGIIVGPNCFITKDLTIHAEAGKNSLINYTVPYDNYKTLELYRAFGRGVINFSIDSTTIPEYYKNKIDTTIMPKTFHIPNIKQTDWRNILDLIGLSVDKDLKKLYLSLPQRLYGKISVTSPETLATEIYIVDMDRDVYSRFDNSGAVKTQVKDSKETTGLVLSSKFTSYKPPTVNAFKDILKIATYTPKPKTLKPIIPLPAKQTYIKIWEPGDLSYVIEPNFIKKTFITQFNDKKINLYDLTILPSVEFIQVLQNDGQRLLDDILNDLPTQTQMEEIINSEDIEEVFLFESAKKGLKEYNRLKNELLWNSKIKIPFTSPQASQILSYKIDLLYNALKKIKIPRVIYDDTSYYGVEPTIIIEQIPWIDSNAIIQSTSINSMTNISFETIDKEFYKNLEKFLTSSSENKFYYIDNICRIFHEVIDKIGGEFDDKQTISGLFIDIKKLNLIIENIKKLKNLNTNTIQKPTVIEPIAINRTAIIEENGNIQLPTNDLIAIDDEDNYDPADEPAIFLNREDSEIEYEYAIQESLKTAKIGTDYVNRFHSLHDNEMFPVAREVRMVSPDIKEQQNTFLLNDLPKPPVEIFVIPEKFNAIIKEVLKIELPEDIDYTISQKKDPNYRHMFFGKEQYRQMEWRVQQGHIEMQQQHFKEEYKNVPNPIELYQKSLQYAEDYDIVKLFIEIHKRMRLLTIFTEEQEEFADFVSDSIRIYKKRYIATFEKFGLDLGCFNKVVPKAAKRYTYQYIPSKPVPND